MSAPATKLLSPAPVRTTQRTVFWSMASKAAFRSARTSGFRAFSAFGRSMVRTATAVSYTHLINDGISLPIEKAVEVEEKLFGGCFETHDQVEGMEMCIRDRPWPIVPAPITPTFIVSTSKLCCCGAVGVGARIRPRGVGDAAPYKIVVEFSYS